MNQGKLERILNASGKVSGFEVSVRHDGLKEFKVCRAKTKRVTLEMAEFQLEEWEEMYRVYQQHLLEKQEQEEMRLST